MEWLVYTLVVGSAMLMFVAYMLGRIHGYARKLKEKSPRPGDVVTVKSGGPSWVVINVVGGVAQCYRLRNNGPNKPYISEIVEHYLHILRVVREN